MLDSQHRQQVIHLEQQADEAQLARDLAKDRFEIAVYQAKLPHRYRWQRHGTAWVIAGIVGISGTVYALEKEAPYGIPVAAGAALGVGLLSNAMDKHRQILDKQDRLELCRCHLAASEKTLRQAVTLYREEEEMGWLMYALNLSRERMLSLRAWMSDPRRTMKDAVLESIDRVAQLVGRSPADPSSALATERQYRQMRQRLFEDAMPLKKDEFLAQVFAKHHLLREQELAAVGIQADVWIKGTAVTAGVTAGLLTGMGVTAWGAKAALGSSKMAAIAHTVTGTASIAAVVGTGLLAAKTVHHWLSQAEEQRRQREAQQFQDAFTCSTQILEAVMAACQTEDKNARQLHLQAALDQVQTLKRQALKTQDLPMKQFVEILGDLLLQATKPRVAQPMKVVQALGTRLAKTVGA